MVVPLYDLPTSNESSSCSTFLSTFGIGKLFDFSLSGDEQWYHMVVLFCISLWLMTNDVEHSFVRLLGFVSHLNFVLLQK